MTSLLKKEKKKGGKKKERKVNFNFNIDFPIFCFFNDLFTSADTINKEEGNKAISQL